MFFTKWKLHKAAEKGKCKKNGFFFGSRHRSQFTRYKWSDSITLGLCEIDPLILLTECHFACFRDSVNAGVCSEKPPLGNKIPSCFPH